MPFPERSFRQNVARRMEKAPSMEKASIRVRMGEPGMAGPSREMKIGLLTGCQDRHYAFGIAMELIAKGIHVDVIGSDDLDSPELHVTPGLRFLNMRGSQRQNANVIEKFAGLIAYYARLIAYASRPDPKILHILWNNKFEYFDRTILMAYYKLCGKKIVMTAHNVNQAKRDSTDSLFNRLTLRIQYHLADHIFAHTEKMKTELCREFGVAANAITVIKYPINNAFADTDLTPLEAKSRLGIRPDEKAILFFGRISRYKGIDYLMAAFQQLLAKDSSYRLIIAGNPKKGNEALIDEIRQALGCEPGKGRIILKAEFIPDQDIELYLKGADVLVLPYKDIFQSGILFLAYGFGLPVVATDVGSFREVIIEGKTGFICKAGAPADLARAVETYFASDLYRNVDISRQQIRKYANTEHSWSAVGESTRDVYAGLLGSSTI
jgi:glycosyltransferase involved in cell wall biosynthesis